MCLLVPLAVGGQVGKSLHDSFASVPGLQYFILTTLVRYILKQCRINLPCGSWVVSLSLWIDIGIVLWTAVPTGGNCHRHEAPPVAICPKSLTRQTRGAWHPSDDVGCSFVPFYDTLLCSTATVNRTSCAVNDPSCGMAEHHFSASRYSLHHWYGGS